MKTLCVFLVLVLTLGLLSGCASQTVALQSKQYTATYLSLFDTVTTILGRADSEDAFRETAQTIHDELLIYHQLFDIYQEYEGMNNLKTVNDSAGIAPVKVDRSIIELLMACKEFYESTGTKVNVAMGSVLQLWHDARNAGLDDPANAKLPEWSALVEASNHTDFSSVVIDDVTSTVYIKDPGVRLDVGAVAKGWSVQEVAEHAPEGILISVGGNVCATGPKDDSGTPWVVGIQNIDNSADYLHTVYVKDQCVVTSGDYQRTYAVDGKLYHHIIDPETLYPSTKWRSVTIICRDSGAADALSTALFLMSQDEGQLLLDQYDAEALWVDAAGTKYYSPGFQSLIRT